MSILSSLTGVHISKKGVHIEPMKALGTALTVGSMGGFGPVAGALSHLPGAAKVAGAIAGLKKIGGSGVPNVDVGSIVNHSGVLGDNPVPEEGGFMGGLKKVGGFLGNHGDQLLGAASLGEGYMNQRKSNNLSNEALNLARQSYADRAGLRKLGVSQMLDQTPPDLSSTFAQPSNPYALRKVG